MNQSSKLLTITELQCRSLPDRTPHFGTNTLKAPEPMALVADHAATHFVGDVAERSGIEG